MAFTTKVEKKVEELKRKLETSRKEGKERKEAEAKLIAQARAEARAKEKLMQEQSRQEKLDIKLEKIRRRPEAAKMRQERFKKDIKTGRKSLGDKIIGGWSNRGMEGKGIFFNLPPTRIKMPKEKKQKPKKKKKNQSLEL